MNNPALEAAIKVELDADATLAAKTDDEVRRQLSAKTATKSKHLGSTTLLYWLAGSDRMKRLKAAANYELHPIHGTAHAVYLMLQHPNAFIDLGDPAQQQLVAGFVQAGVLTQAEADELTAMGTETVSWSSLYGADRVRASNVAAARLLS